jgi:hypothetical protein
MCIFYLFVKNNMDSYKTILAAIVGAVMGSFFTLASVVLGAVLEEFYVRKRTKQNV